MIGRTVANIKYDGKKDFKCEIYHYIIIIQCKPLFIYVHIVISYHIFF
jgi:hypothetical protein